MCACVCVCVTSHLCSLFQRQSPCTPNSNARALSHPIDLVSPGRWLVCCLLCALIALTVVVAIFVVTTGLVWSHQHGDSDVTNHHQQQQVFRRSADPPITVIKTGEAVASIKL
jgi:hypothetical protein